LGLEIKAAYIAVNEVAGEIGSGDNDYWRQKCRVLFMRPAIEPIFLSYHPKVRDLSLDLVSTRKLVSALIAGEPVLREREGIGRSASGNVGFELPERARGWLDRLVLADAKPELATFMPMYTFAATIMAHPFADGNGRLARLLTLGALSKLAGWETPSLALAPSFYRHAETLGIALDIASERCEWTPFVEAFLAILEDACVLGEHAWSR